MPSIFLSHSSRDKFFVRELARRIEGAGVHVWLDEAEINVGDSLTDRLGTAIEHADFVGAVLSTASVNSIWVQKELQVALQKEIRGRKVVVLPILLEPVEVPAFLKDKVYADFTSSEPEKFNEGLRRLLRALGVKEERIPALPVAQAAPPSPPATALPPSARRLAEFVDLRIGELDDQRTHRPDATRALFNVYFRLTERPPDEWVLIFDAERRFPRHSMWRRAWIEGTHVVVQCPLDEIEQYHHRDLTEDVANANTKYREFLTQEAQEEARRLQAADGDLAKIRALKRKL